MFLEDTVTFVMHCQHDEELQLKINGLHELAQTSEVKAVRVEAGPP